MDYIPLTSGYWQRTQKMFVLLCTNKWNTQIACLCSNNHHWQVSVCAMSIDDFPCDIESSSYCYVQLVQLHHFETFLTNCILSDLSAPVSALMCKTIFSYILKNWRKVKYIELYNFRSKQVFQNGDKWNTFNKTCVIVLWANHGYSALADFKKVIVSIVITLISTSWN